jgi:hypothetical protein
MFLASVDCFILIQRVEDVEVQQAPAKAAPTQAGLQLHCQKWQSRPLIS